LHWNSDIGRLRLPFLSSGPHKLMLWCDDLDACLQCRRLEDGRWVLPRCFDQLDSIGRVEFFGAPPSIFNRPTSISAYKDLHLSALHSTLRPCQLGSYELYTDLPSGRPP
jgi:hypothetical protein